MDVELPEVNPEAEEGPLPLVGQLPVGTFTLGVDADRQRRRATKQLRSAISSSFVDLINRSRFD